jgi:tRNA-dihydrouridine synthase 3
VSPKTASLGFEIPPLTCHFFHFFYWLHRVNFDVYAELVKKWESERVRAAHERRGAATAAVTAAAAATATAAADAVPSPAAPVAAAPSSKKNDAAGRAGRLRASLPTFADAEPPTLDHWRGMTYLAPLTTVGNLPFRRLCVDLGVDITCGEMARSIHLLKGVGSEWALTKRHASERIFGVQIEAAYGDIAAQATEVIARFGKCVFWGGIGFWF